MSLMAKEFLDRIMKPTVEGATSLLQRESESEGDGYFESAAIIVFLSGVDKVLGVALQLLYIANKVNWDWIKPRKPIPGVIGCGPGLTKKLNKFEALGIDLSGLSWMVDLRNNILHDASLSIRYKVGICEESDSLCIAPQGPAIDYSYSYSQTGISREQLELWSIQLTSEIGAFLDAHQWFSVWRTLEEKVATLSSYPVDSSISDKSIQEQAQKLNEKYIGSGMQHLLPHTSC